MNPLGIKFLVAYEIFAPAVEGEIIPSGHTAGKSIEKHPNRLWWAAPIEPLNKEKEKILICLSHTTEQDLKKCTREADNYLNMGNVIQTSDQFKKAMDEALDDDAEFFRMFGDKLIIKHTNKCGVRLMCELLKALGYSDGVELFEKREKHYA